MQSLSRRKYWHRSMKVKMLPKLRNEITKSDVKYLFYSIFEVLKSGYMSINDIIVQFYHLNVIIILNSKC